MIYPCTHPILDDMIYEFCIFRSPVQHDRFNVYALDCMGSKLFCYAVDKTHEDAVVYMMEAYRLYSVGYQQHTEILLEDDDF